MSEKPQEDLLESIISKSVAQQEEARRAARSEERRVGKECM